MMNDVIVIYGESGAGKTFGIKTLNPETNFVIQCRRKMFSFAGAKAKYSTWGRESNPNGNYIYSNKADVILQMLNHISDKMPHIKSVVIDDLTHTMSDEFMMRSKEVGFQKFNDIGYNVWSVLDGATKLREDLTVIIIMHPEVSKDGRKLKIKTIGDMVDTKVDLPSLFTTVLYANCRIENEKVHRYLLTQSDGFVTAKSPEGLFDKLEIPNDYGYILEKLFIHSGVE